MEERDLIKTKINKAYSSGAKAVKRAEDMMDGARAFAATGAFIAATGTLVVKDVVAPSEVVTFCLVTGLTALGINVVSIQDHLSGVANLSIKNISKDVLRGSVILSITVVLEIVDPNQTSLFIETAILSAVMAGLGVGISFGFNCVAEAYLDKVKNMEKHVRKRT